MNKPFILATNVHNLEKGQSAKDSEVSVGVLLKDIFKEEPTLYAYRQGMVYNPIDFKPDVSGGHKLPEKLIEAYYSLLVEARKNLNLLKGTLGGQGGQDNSEQVEQLQKLINQKNIRIQEQTEKIAELMKNGGGQDNSDQVKTLEKMIQTLASVQSNRIEIAIEGKSTKIIEKVLHENFTKIVGLLAKKQAVYMHGPAGTGKSQLAEDIAEALEVDFYPASTITQEFKLTGYKDAGGVYHETNFYKAMKYGGVFFLDEMDSCISDVLVGINGALANGYFDFPCGTVRAHKDFMVIGAGNTIGRGGDAQYTGRSVLDLSTLDRFWGVEVEYSPAIDKAVCNGDMDLVEFANEFRKVAKENDIHVLLSYRSLSRIANFQDMFSLKEIMEMAVIKGVASDDIRMLARNMNINSTNKYLKALKEASK